MKTSRITKIVGTGGIGMGQFFLFHSEKALGRNESRMAELSDAKDYCKLHIVFHYLSELLAPRVSVFPVGMVGDDGNGRELLEMLKKVGANVEWVGNNHDHPTMYSICFQYPNKSGGNITTDNSACMDVTPVYVRNAVSSIGISEDTIAVALPEVPFESRMTLLKHSKDRGAFCVASCAAEEMSEFVQAGGPDLCDLIAVNQEEAAVFANVSAIESETEAENAAKAILKRYPHLTLWLTYGSKGSLLADKTRCVRYEALKNVSVKNTGGAGDASLAGLLCGYCMGLPFFGNAKEAVNGFTNAGELAVLIAGMSVESADSIDVMINWDALRARKDRENRIAL